MSSNYIPYSRQTIEDDDISAVVTALKSDFLTTGPTITRFEEVFAKYVGAKYAVTVANATAGLHIAVMALDIPKNSEGITSPITFMASANAMVYSGITPRFADIEPNTYNIDVGKIKNTITKKTKIIIPVHFAGQPCEMKQVAKLAKDNKLFVVEDAAHAIGSKYANGKRVGNCEYSDMTVFSFHAVKTMTTGEGGMITTNNHELYEKLLLLRSHGIVRDTENMIDNPGPWYHEMHVLGYNYRLTDIQAALGISQLNKIDKFIARRREIIGKYNQELKNLSWLRIPFENKKDYSAFHLYVLQIDFQRIGKTRKVVMEELFEKGIGTQVHYIPVHLQPYYRKHYGYHEGNCPIAESYYERAISIPLFPMLTDSEVEMIIDVIKNLPI